MDKVVSSILKASDPDVPSNEQNEFDVDRSSSLSEIEDKGSRESEEEYEEEEDGNKEDLAVYEDLSNISEVENDSEAETECLERSPKKPRPHQNVILSSSSNFGYDRCLNNLKNQFKSIDRRGDEEEPIPSAEIMVDASSEFTKISFHEESEGGISVAQRSLRHRNLMNNENISDTESHNRKRKRSIMGGTGIEDLSEPLCKRTGSVLTNCGGYSIEDEVNEDISNPATENLSADEGEVLQDDSAEDTEELNEAPQIKSEPTDLNVSLRRLGCQKRSDKTETMKDEGEPEKKANIDSKIHDADENISSTCILNEEDDENEVTLKNEEAIKRKKVALDRLGDIERQFSTFRDRLYEERLKMLNYEDAMLRQTQPTHPGFIAMLKSVDAKRDEKIRRADKLREYEFQSLKKVAVAQRSQILVQYQQEIRDVRERKLEQLGEQWYKIQHDRRSYAGICPDYSLKFSSKKSQQISNQIAYCNEVSLLSGVAKYVGFPAAPIMAPASAAELEEDLEKMGRSKQLSHVAATLPLQELVALHTTSSNPKPRPAEEQFIEQTPWANPQHPLHAHVLQKQTFSSQILRTMSPFSQNKTSSRQSCYSQAAVPNTGIFSNIPAIQHTPVAKIPLLQNQFKNSGSTHQFPSSSLGSHQKSLSPHLNRASTNIQDQEHELSNIQVMNKFKGNTLSSATGVSIDYVIESRLST